MNDILSRNVLSEDEYLCISDDISNCLILCTEYEFFAEFYNRFKNTRYFKEPRQQNLNEVTFSFD